jgi:hypothetical protein
LKKLLPFDELLLVFSSVVDFFLFVTLAVVDDKGDKSSGIAFNF